MRANTFFKASALSAIATLMIAPASLTAGQPIDVHARVGPSITEWSSAVSQDLDRSLTAIANAPLQHRRLPNGLVSVRFRLNEAGRPEAIEIAQKSGSAELDGIGRQAVARLQNVHALPSGVGKDQVFEANILIASDGVEYDRQFAALRQRQETLAAARQEGRVLAFAVAAGSPQR